MISYDGSGRGAPDSSEIVSAIRAAAHKLGRAPTRAEFTRLSGISHFKVLARFSSLREAIRQAGMEPNPQGLRISSSALLQDWGEIARKLRCLPSRSQYLRHGSYSAGVFTLRFGSWAAVPESFRRFTAENDLIEKWTDVLALIHGGRNEEPTGRDAALPRLPPVDLGRNQEPTHGDAAPPRLPAPLVQQRCITPLVLALIVNTLAPPSTPDVPLPECRITPLPNALASLPHPTRSLFRDRHVLGSPLALPGLAHEPVNETGVVFLFGILAHRLGFQVESLRSAFPDCEAVRQIQPGKWQRVRIEFEFESRNFLAHRHPHQACDVIVCWRHNWLECPDHLEVVELRKVLGRP